MLIIINKEKRIMKLDNVIYKRENKTIYRDGNVAIKVYSVPLVKTQFQKSN